MTSNKIGDKNQGRPTRFPILRGDLFDLWESRKLGNRGDAPNRYGTKKMPISVLQKNQQHRIVAKIDQLMSLCDTLDQQIDTTTGKQTELLNAVMAQV
jgi:hypothetical protein